jgi:Flp pilus assembly protein TadD
VPSVRYRKVLELQPGNIFALNNVAYALAVLKNQPTDALPLAHKAASLAPRNGSILDTLGWIEHLLGNHEVAAGSSGMLSG